MRVLWLVLPLLCGLHEPSKAASDPQLVDLSECLVHRPSQAEPVYARDWMMREAKGEREQGYVLPLEVTILSVNPKAPLCYDQPSVLVELLMTNRGADPYRLPVSRDSILVIEPENRRRTAFRMEVCFGGEDERIRACSSVVTTYAAANVPGSYHVLDPGQSVKVKVSVPLRERIEMFLKNGTPPENLARLGIDVYEDIDRDQPGGRRSGTGRLHSKNAVRVAEILP